MTDIVFLLISSDQPPGRRRGRERGPAAGHEPQAASAAQSALCGRIAIAFPWTSRSSFGPSTSVGHGVHTIFNKSPAAPQVRTRASCFQPGDQLFQHRTAKPWKENLEPNRRANEGKQTKISDHQNQFEIQKTLQKTVINGQNKGRGDDVLFLCSVADDRPSRIHCSEEEVASMAFYECRKSSHIGQSEHSHEAENRCRGSLSPYGILLCQIKESDRGERNSGGRGERAEMATGVHYFSGSSPHLLLVRTHYPLLHLS